MNSQAQNPKLTVTLTGRRPVTITKADWPIMAQAEESIHDGQVECQANVRTKWALRVRAHADGRAIVYGTYRYTTQWQGARDYDIRGGEIGAAGEPLPAIIRRVGEWMQRNLPTDHQEDGEEFGRLINECIADLPAENI